ncbi:MAG TPA: helix-turn-helix domain-containing protein [Actinocatenispora sp.]
MTDINGPRSASASDDGELLRLAAPTPATATRADAARNRAKILDAAERLFDEQGVTAVSMDAVATAAGVGKGTLFRRFGDKSGLAVAVLDARETVLQQAILSGPPPLGPGAPPTERLRAFLTAYAEFLDTHLDLIRVSETASPGARYRIGAYRFWHRHVAILLRAARPELDHEYLAHVLLAPLAGDLRAALRDRYPTARAAATLDGLVVAQLG